MAGTWTCSEQGHFGSLGDNKVIVTGGIEAAPATFADFVTEDRAGTATLLAATNCAKDMTLTYQIRPCELRALQISFVIASKTAQTDYIWATGTDAWGTALSEAIDISAGNGTYTSVQYFATITDIDVEDAGDGTGTAAADGTLAVTQGQWGLIWDHSNSIYTSNGTFAVGDASTSTYFTSLNDTFYVDGSFDTTVTANATIQIGELDGDWGKNGSEWKLSGIGNTVKFCNGGTVLIYASKIKLVAAHQQQFWTGTAKIKNSIFDCGGESDWQRAWFVQSFFTSIEMEDVYFSNQIGLYLSLVPDIFDDVHCHAVSLGVIAHTASGIIATGFRVTEASNVEIQTWTAGAAADMRVRDPKTPVGTIQNYGNESNFIQEEYTCNIHVVDRDGAAIQSATVVCDDQADAEIFSVSTDASGDIAEQIVPYKIWETTSETLTTHSPHKFTISKAGYETLILEAITVDAPIVWHLELQTPKAPKSARRHNQ